MNSTIGAIFLPCRGGGTATTYYTDHHDVDEDLRTAAEYGGWWGEESWTGIFRSSIYNVPTLASDTSASRLIYLS